MCFTHLMCGQKQNSLALRLPHQSFGRKPVNCSPPIPFSDLWEKPSLVLRFPLLTGEQKTSLFLNSLCQTVQIYQFSPAIPPDESHAPVTLCFILTPRQHAGRGRE